eukprot:Seg5447.3 transcript_id=Seg5447.3/GoldUCD/mRNA.D3Y31 product="52 kDa repressor of the inhibitor of the protein kinase" protein_id=Seg5447.3/GoldUCD/D3Y31
MEMMKGYQEIEDIKEDLKSLRDNLELKNHQWFKSESNILVDGFNIVPTVIFGRTGDDSWLDGFTRFTEAYNDDLPIEKSLNAELDRWYAKWSKVPQKDMPDRISSTLLQTDPLSYPNIYAELKIIATVPITTSECERSISVLRRLKTYLRGTMKQDRMNGLALPCTQRENGNYKHIGQRHSQKLNLQGSLSKSV